MMNPILNDDDRILALLKADDEYAMTLLFDQFHLLLSEALRKYVPHQDEIEELIHELLITIWTKRHTLNITMPIARYLLKAALNRARNHIRDQNRAKQHVINHPEINLLQHTALDNPADSELHIQDIQALLELAFSRMSISMKLCFQLSRSYNMTYPQIAKFMGISVKMVEKNISNALKVITPLFEPYLKVIILLNLLQ